MARGRQSGPGGIEFKRGAPRWGQTDQDRIRAKIADTGVVLKLAECLEGTREMTQGQIAIGLKFLDKLVPQLQASQVEVTENAPYAVIPSVLEDKKAWSGLYAPPAVKAVTAQPVASEGKASPKGTKH